MPFSDSHFDAMTKIIARYPRSRSAIMPLLHYVQSIDGYVTQEGIEIIAQKLQLETAEVNAVATFYLSLIHIPSPRDLSTSRMPSSA